jgi:hypothetical protein
MSPALGHALSRRCKQERELHFVEAVRRHRAARRVRLAYFAGLGVHLTCPERTLQLA